MNADQRQWSQIVEKHGRPAVDEAMAGLPPRDVEILTRRCTAPLGEHETLTAISKQWGVTPPCVRSASLRALRRLRDALDPPDPPKWVLRRERERERERRTPRMDADLQWGWAHLQGRYGAERLEAAVRKLPNRQCALVFYRFLADFASDDYPLLAARLHLPNDPLALCKRLRTVLRKLERNSWDRAYMRSLDQ